MQDDEHRHCAIGITPVSATCTSELSDVPSKSHDGSTKRGLSAQISTATTEIKNLLGISRTNTAANAPRTWKASFWRLAPLSGIFCMCLAVASITAALGILIGSRGASTSSWVIPPSTYLAICTAVSNQAIRFAAFHGLAVAWWRKATKGTTLRQLHTSWRAGMTASGAILSGRKMGLIGLACLFSTLVSIDGPFLQKATTIKSALRDAPPITLNVSISQEIPTDSTGGWYKEGRITDRWSKVFNETKPSIHGEVSNLIYSTYYMSTYVEGAWFRNDPIPGVVQGCPHDQICKATIRAPALAATSCVSKSMDVDYWVPLADLKHLQSDDDMAPPLSTMSFIVDFSLIPDETDLTVQN